MLSMVDGVSSVAVVSRKSCCDDNALMEVVVAVVVGVKATGEVVVKALVVVMLMDSAITQMERNNWIVLFMVEGDIDSKVLMICTILMKVKM